MENNNQINTEKRLTGVEKDVLYMRESLVRIESNHLVHINDQLMTLNKVSNDNQTAVIELITTKINEVYSKISDLKLNDAKNEPQNNLINDIIKYVILAVIAGGVTYLVNKH